MISRALSSAEMGCQIGQSETGRDFDEGSFSRMDCCAATSSPESNAEPEDATDTCAMAAAARSRASRHPGRRRFGSRPVQRLWARRKSLQLRPLASESRRKSILLLPRANQVLSAETAVLKLMRKSFEVAVPQIVGSGKPAAARLQRAQAQ